MGAPRTPPLRRFTKRLAKATGGNAMIFVALALPVLVGAAGYGVDMAQLYMWKRELQHSVDQAALAGAYALADDSNSTNYRTRAQQEFDANENLTTNIASAPSIALADYDGGTDNSIIVSASAQKMLAFSGFLVNKAMYVHVTAQATFAEGNQYKACLMALKKGESGTFTIGGSATVHAQCGIGALSCEDNAIIVDGSATVDTNSIATCGTADVPSELQSTVTDHASVSNPFDGIPAPKPDDDTAKTFSCPSNPNSGTQYMTPGRYTGGLNLKCTVVLSSGIYVVDGGVLDMSDQHANVTGNGVLFVLKNGAKLKLGGQGNAGTVNLSPMEAGDFAGTVNGNYKDYYGGMLFYEDDTGQTSPVSQSILGNANVSLKGTMYLPNSDVTVSGNSSLNPLCFQIWASTVTISGSTTMTTTCTANQTNSAGTSSGTVKLVA
jgi:Flp pilus assembly protein TadG